ncbi:MAG: PAS domain-containing sensor histidine kinase [Gemmatimonadetes bacterium]|nr:MAG: PAS domain-containing sensor histidine kinase [Gemmatimonadota bacterium]
MIGTGLSLERRIQIGFGIAVAIIVAVGAAALRSTEATVSSAQWVAHTLQVRAELEAGFADLIEAETGVRGYVITGDTTYLAPYHSARATLNSRLAGLRALTADNPAQQRRLDSLDTLVATRLERFQWTIETRRTGGPAAAARAVSGGRGKELIRLVHDVITQMEEDEGRLLAQRSVTLQAKARLARLAAWTGALVALALAGLASVLVGREMAGRRVAEERLRLLVGSVRDYAIYMVDPAGYVKSWNAGAERIKGYAPPEILGQHFARFFTPEDVAAGRPAAVLHAAATEGRYEEENWRLRKDGSRFWADVVITAVRDERGALLGFAKVTRDLTERKRAEQALRASEERFRILAVTANDAILSADARGHITYFNPGAERIFGLTSDEVIDRPLTTLMPERFREAHRAGLARYVATGEARVIGKTVELAGRRKDGTEFPLELSLATWKHGSEVAFTAIIRDITARKEGEDQRRRYAAQLEAANKELEAFSYSVSHDLRAPLRGIDGFSQALLEDYHERLDDTGRDFLQRVRAGSQRMATLIDDLLSLSRVTRSELQLAEVNLSTLAAATAAELQKSDPTRAVMFSIAPDLVVRADPGLMRIVLQNLLGNAWKFTAKRSPAHVEFGVTANDNGRAYFVRDDGAGFDMAYAAKLFGAFQRLHAAAEFPGTGIGLATVQRIVHRHGGQVWAEAAPERGATFYFTL